MELYKIAAAIMVMFSWGVGSLAVEMINQKTYKPKLTKVLMTSIIVASVIGLVLFVAKLSIHHILVWFGVCTN